MLTPVNKCIFVKADKPPEKKGNIFMPPSDVRVCSGIVQASDSPLCKPGDLISYARFWPTTVRGVDLIVVDERDLVGVEPDPVPYDASAEEAASECGKGLLEPPTAPQLVTPGPRRLIH